MPLPIFDVFDFCNALSINDQNKKDVELFPNPASEKVYFKGLDNYTEVSVYDVFGRLILKNKTNENSLDISELESGIYYFEFYVQENKIVKKVIVN